MKILRCKIPIKPFLKPSPIYSGTPHMNRKTTEKIVKMIRSVLLIFKRYQTIKDMSTR